MTIERGKEWFGRIFLVALAGGVIIAYICGAFWGAASKDEKFGLFIGLIVFIVWVFASLFRF